MPTLKLCVGYEREGVIYDDLPLGIYQMDMYRPVYQEMPAWDQDLQTARTWDDLPPQAQEYIRTIEEQVGVKIGWISVGPEREQMVQMVDAG